MRFDLRLVTASALVVGLVGWLAAPALAQTRNPDREAYFGETHVHTSWSLTTPLDWAGVTDHSEYVRSRRGRS